MKKTYAVNLSELDEDTLNYIKLDLLKYFVERERKRNKIFCTVVTVLTSVSGLVTVAVITSLLIKLFGAVL